VTDYFRDIWDKLKSAIEDELTDLRYMEVLSAVSDKIEGDVNAKEWDILQALREPDPTPEAKSAGIQREDMLNLSNTTIIARTRLELDGDILFLLRGEDGMPLTPNNELIDLHKWGVDVSVKNWHFFLLSMIEVAKIVGEIVEGVQPKTIMESSTLSGRSVADSVSA
jgi:hypothetical protein